MAFTLMICKCRCERGTCSTETAEGQTVIPSLRICSRLPVVLRNIGCGKLTAIGHFTQSVFVITATALFDIEESASNIKNGDLIMFHFANEAALTATITQGFPFCGA